MLNLVQIICLLFMLVACSKKEVIPLAEPAEDLSFISAVDLSSFPEILESDPVFYNLENLEDNPLHILHETGVNTVRLRLWVNPTNGHSEIKEVKKFAQSLKLTGFKLWLTLHYSDTWADPAHQQPPVKWQGISFSALKDSLYNYTELVMQEIQPDYIQIGNEINTGLLHPYGQITSQPQQCIDLLSTGIAAVRANSDDTKIMLHYAGTAGADWFFEQVKPLDYDIIGLSFYPIWHGKSLVQLEHNMQNLSTVYNKEVVIAETAYPFTLDWNDWTDNIVGLEKQLILPDYPATPVGQKQFIKALITSIKAVALGTGFCYWGGELIAWKGIQGENASPWENQALFDFKNKALPVLEEFKNN